MPAETTNETTLTPEEIQAGKVAFERLLPRYREIPADRVQIPRVNVPMSAMTALGVAKKVNEPARRGLFEKLPAERFNPEALDLLEPAARAAMFAQAQLANAGAVASEAKIPAALAVQGVGLRERMLRVCDYHLTTEELARLIVEDIRQGTGYADLAEDLGRLSGLYREHTALLSRDPTHYLATDPDDAERVAKQIHDSIGLGRTPRQREEYDLAARAWTYLLEIYEHIARPGRWLFHDEGGEELFVSLRTAGRRPPRRRNRASAS